MRPIKIIKANGDEDYFDSLKLKNSLVRAGASENCQDAVISQVLKEIVPGMTTMQIYGHAFKALKKCEMAPASRYSLKQALFQLGPSGFPFERFIGELWKAKGYKVEIGQIIQGRYVKHEVDVIANRKGEVNMMECKYHNEWGARSGLKIALYVDARMKDLAARCRQMKKYECKLFKGWLITNTKLSEDAIQYGEGAGLSMMAWAYPHQGNLQHLIEQTGLHPITVISTLDKNMIFRLLSRNVVLCRQVDTRVLKSIGLNAASRSVVEHEIRALHEHMS